MELEFTTYVYIDIDYIIECNNIDRDTSTEDIFNAVRYYVDGLDDCDYCLIGDEEKKKIAESIKEKVGAQMSLFD